MGHHPCCCCCARCCHLWNPYGSAGDNQLSTNLQNLLTDTGTVGRGTGKVNALSWEFDGTNYLQWNVNDPTNWPLGVRRDCDLFRWVNPGGGYGLDADAHPPCPEYYTDDVGDSSYSPGEEFLLSFWAKSYRPDGYDAGGPIPNGAITLGLNLANPNCSLVVSFNPDAGRGWRVEIYDGVSAFTTYDSDLGADNEWSLIGLWFEPAGPTYSSFDPYRYQWQVRIFIDGSWVTTLPYSALDLWKNNPAQQRMWVGGIVRFPISPGYFQGEIDQVRYCSCNVDPDEEMDVLWNGGDGEPNP